MCGIAGCVTKAGKIDRDKFAGCVDIISHRGPDSRGLFYDGNVALGHRRLAIIDTSDAGRQPFTYRKNYTIVFNGEIYNYIELRDELKEEGFEFKSDSDTEVVIASYVRWGSECVNHFNGMWSFTIYDKKNGLLFCSRDRFGVKPFYYCENNIGFAFASEIKQLIFLSEDRPKANINRLSDYLIWGEIDHSQETMFDNVYQLRPGENLTYDLQKREFTKTKYYDLVTCPKKEKRAKNLFRSSFVDSVRLRLRADVPVGYCLSGGLDSSAIVSVADMLSRKGEGLAEQHTITSCFEDVQYDEREYAEAVIEQSDVIPHYVFPDVNQLFDELDKVIWHMDEPFGSTSIYAQWNVFRCASENGLKVMLDGQGADEQLAGYTNFYMVYFIYLIRHFKWIRLIREVQSYVKLRSTTEKHISSKKLIVASIVQAVLPFKLRRWLMKKVLERTDSPFSASLISERSKYRNHYDSGNYKKYFYDSIYCGMQELLHYEDRDSMAFSVESRVPFLDYHLVETIADIPFEEKISRGKTKNVMREGLEGVLPDKIKNRYSKLGFVTPEDKWIQENPQLFREEVLKAANRLKGVLNPEEVMSWYDRVGHNIKRGDFTVWRLICAGHWADVFDVQI